MALLIGSAGTACYGRRWTDKSAEEQRAVYGNRRRVRGKRGKRLGRLRSEYAERSFAHTCETGGARRSRLRGLIDVAKRYLMYVAARNLGVMMRALFNMGTPRSLQTEGAASSCAVGAWIRGLWMSLRSLGREFEGNVNWSSLIAPSTPIRYAA